MTIGFFGPTLCTPAMTQPATLHRPATLLALILSGLMAAAAHAAPTYVAKLLDTPVADNCYLNDVNEKGQVVGACISAENGGYTAYVTTAKGKRTNAVGLLTGTQSWTNGINDAGVMVGDATIEGDLISHGWIKTPDGAMTDLGTLGGDNSIAVDINNKGLIVGFSQVDASSVFAGFVIQPGTTALVRIKSLGGSFTRLATSNLKGVVIGSSQLPGDLETRAFYSRPPYNKPVMLDSLGGPNSAAYAINDQGTIVGSTQVAVTKLRRAYKAQVGSSAITELPTPAGRPATATGINNQGVIVGTYQDPTTSTNNAFSCAGECTTFTNLNTVTTGLAPGVVLTNAQRVNDKGMITALGSDSRLYLLLPQVQ